MVEPARRHRVRALLIKRGVAAFHLQSRKTSSENATAVWHSRVRHLFHDTLRQPALVRGDQLEVNRADAEQCNDGGLIAASDDAVVVRRRRDAF
jgi:hypothetical protein